MIPASLLFPSICSIFLPAKPRLADGNVNGWSLGTSCDLNRRMVPGFGGLSGLERFGVSGFMTTSGYGAWAHGYVSVWLMGLGGLDLAL
ncbi:hypothetical protein LIER_35721 [Lithospermum erythrorhizon]|uniref:Uncharacterized protein n=1 Tax=Lithospermum erythrorhizon TaxID=34254 RepID=A0AAV3NW14_LITER